MVQTVAPSRSGTFSSFHRNAVQPHPWTSMPRCFRHHSRSAAAARALKKTPPIPVARLMLGFRSKGSKAEREEGPVVVDEPEPGVERRGPGIRPLGLELERGEAQIPRGLDDLPEDP